MASRSIGPALFAVSFLVVAACASPFGSDDSPPSPDGTNLSPADRGLVGAPEPGEKNDPPRLGLHKAKGGGPPTGSSGPPGDITWHNGEIMRSSDITPIFWGVKWSDATFTGDKVSGLGRLYGGLAGSVYAASNNEYTGSNGQVTTGAGTVTVHDALIDTSAGPSHAPRTSTIGGEVCKLIPKPVANGYYPIYTDLPRGGAGYCAWHSYGSCYDAPSKSYLPMQFAFFFNLDGDSGCNPDEGDPKVTGHSQGLAALVNVSGHEWSETITDPRNGGWWDSANNENADKCAWAFGNRVQLGTGLNPDGTPETWKIQGNWSNAAYDADGGPTAGYANTKGQKACLPL